MVIMDKFNCRYCGKEVTLEDEIDLGIDRYDVDLSCTECYNDNALDRLVREQMEYEYWTSQSSYWR